MEMETGERTIDCLRVPSGSVGQPLNSHALRITSRLRVTTPLYLSSFLNTHRDTSESCPARAVPGSLCTTASPDCPFSRTDRAARESRLWLLPHRMCCFFFGRGIVNHVGRNVMASSILLNGKRYDASSTVAKKSQYVTATLVSVV